MDACHRRAFGYTDGCGVPHIRGRMLQEEQADGRGLTCLLEEFSSLASFAITSLAENTSRGFSKWT